MNAEHDPHAPSVPRHRAHEGMWLGFHVDWRAAVLAGLAAGFLFLILEIVTAVLLGAETPFGPAQVTLEGLTRGTVGPDGALIVAGIFLHFVFAVAITIPLALFIHPWKEPVLVGAMGALLGFFLFFLNVQLLDYLLPVWTESRNVILLVNYVIFGATAALLYGRLRARGKRE